MKLTHLASRAAFLISLSPRMEWSRSKLWRDRRFWWTKVFKQATICRLRTSVHIGSAFLWRNPDLRNRILRRVLRSRWSHIFAHLRHVRRRRDSYSRIDMWDLFPKKAGIVTIQQRYRHLRSTGCQCIILYLWTFLLEERNSIAIVNIQKKINLL
jgi:hypothetical protein